MEENPSDHVTQLMVSFWQENGQEMGAIRCEHGHEWVQVWGLIGIGIGTGGGGK